MNTADLQNKITFAGYQVITTELCKIYWSICRYASTFCRESYTAK